MKATVARIINSRLKAVDRLKQRGFRVYPTAANFLFAEHERLSGQQVQQRLKAKGILVRYFDQRRLQQGVRITIGTEEQMERLYQALDEIQSA
ncbi:MAG TPA: aminotransferase class I/II-fold pyridoxal phosphate-dependent enzyme, partial [Firmicutes bacterium]|nr:aminotransferase class I/II-fold pyridoxal phosphate-dependent enzyme [Bacillota bacterium]